MSFDFNLLLALYFQLVAMTVVLYSTWHYNREINGLRDWLFGYIAAFANMTQFMWNPLQSELSLVLSNQITLMATGYFALRGCCRHMDTHFRFDLVGLALAIVVLAVSSYYTIVVDSLPVRFLLSNVASGLFCITGGLIMLRDPFGAYPLRHMFGLTLLAHGLFNALRSGLFAPGVVDFLQRIPLSPTNLILYEQIAMTSLLALGVVLVTNEFISRKLRTYAEHDALTNLYNRRVFLELLEKSRSLAARTGTTLSLLVLDIDHQ